MKTVFEILAILFMAAGTGLVVLRKSRNQKRLKKVANDGYETAHDVLFPRSEIRSKKLHYGPIHPGMK
jgi:hypothetical protein